MKRFARKQTLSMRCSLLLLLASVCSQAMAQAGPVCWLLPPQYPLPANLSPNESDWNSQKLPRGWKFGIGPNLWDLGSQFTGVGDAIIAAAAQWNNAVPGRLFGWDNLPAPTTSDCPSGKPSGKPFQIGAMHFTDTSSCPSLNALKESFQYQEDKTLAYADYNTYENCQYPLCGTKSVTINLARAWTTSQTPLPGVFDLQSVLVHEMGHSLGLAHMSPYGSCIFPDSFDCVNANDTLVPSMQNEVRAGQICQRTIKGNASSFDGDYSNIRQRYPNDH